MKYTVDRFENDIAILEDDMLAFISVPSSLLPDGTKEGSILDYNGAEFVLCLDEDAQRRKKLFDLQNKILNKKQ